MQDKIYQIFVSSTYEDLKDERVAVMSAIADMGYVPVGMEQFPAGDQEQMTYIRKLIDNVDYYVIIIAGRYGHEHPVEKKSYTELEFEYAQSRGIPIAILLHGDRDNIPNGKTEKSPQKQKKLESFIARISKDRVRDHWTDKGGLKYAVRKAIENLIKNDTRPHVGWVREGSINLDGEIVKLQEEIKLLKESAKAQHDAPALSCGEDTYTLSYTTITDSFESQTLRTPYTWNQLFLCVARAIVNPVSIGAISEALEKDCLRGSRIDEEQLHQIVNQFVSLNLIQVDSFVVEGLGPGVSYTLTFEGRKLYANMTAIPKKKDPDTPLWKRFVGYDSLSKEEFLSTYDECVQGLKDGIFTHPGELAHVIATFANLDYHGIKLTDEIKQLMKGAIASMLYQASNQDDLYEIYLKYAQTLNGNSYDKDDTTVQKEMRDYFHQVNNNLRAVLPTKMVYYLESLDDTNVYALREMHSMAPDHGTPYSSLPVIADINAKIVASRIISLSEKARNEFALYIMARYEFHICCKVNNDVAQDLTKLQELHNLLLNHLASLPAIDRLSYKQTMFALSGAIKRCQGDASNLLNTNII